MPIAALPEYLQKQDFSTASPGLRFGMYLPVWTARSDQEKEVKYRARKRSPEAREIREYLDANGMDATIDWLQGRQRNPLPGQWAKNKAAADKAWKNVCNLTSNDKEILSKLAIRQQALFSRLDPDSSCALYATATAPFSTGLGNEHPLENGFAFLWPYGLPYLPGSGVKGVLRQAARELADGIWGDNRGWAKDAVTALFGSEDSNNAQRGALTFWDVIPQIRGDALAVEVMTPHQSDYYQGKEAPHDSGSPNPIYFLTVPPGSGFDFHVTCNPALLKGMDGSENWRELLQAAFELAFDWLGFGAKTAVGYGAMRVDQSREEEQREQAEKEAARRQREAELASMSPVERDIVEIMEGGGDNPPVALFQKLEEGKWDDPDDCRRLAEKIRELWQQEGKWNPGFSGTNKKKAKQKERCLAVLRHLEGGDG